MGGGVATSEPRQPRPGIRWVLAGVLFVVLIAWGLIVRGLTPDPLDPDVVERDVAAEFEEREDVALELDCPESMPVASGEAYLCDGTTPDGESISLSVQIGDELDGSYEWFVFTGPVTTSTPAPQPGG